MDVGLNLENETVQEAGPETPLCVEPGVPVGDALRLLREHRRGSLLVCREGRLAGIFTERDALRLLAAGTDLSAPIETVMSRAPVTVTARDSLSTAIARMSENGYRRLPIVDDQGQPLGVLDAAGIVHWLVEHFPKAVYNLPPISSPAVKDREGP